MDPDAVIESYVGDVVRRLPARRRRDVGPELRSLLDEELAGRAAAAGRPADEAMALDLLAGFGRPVDVADRYRPAGFTVIPPAGAPRFAQVALGGVALQWALTLPGVFGQVGDLGGSSLAGSGDWLTRLGAWWLSWGLGSFWWPGFLVSVSLVAGAIRARREAVAAGAHDADGHPGPRTTSASIPRSVLDRDRVDRPGRVLALGFWALGATVLVALPWLPTLAPGLPQPVLDAFALDPDFLGQRAPWVLVLWAATFGIEIAELVAGRSSSATRRTSLVVDVGWLGLLTWYLLAGPVFVSPEADGVVRVCLVGLLALVVVGLVATGRREMLPTRAPVARGASRGAP